MCVLGSRRSLFRRQFMWCMRPGRFSADRQFCSVKFQSGRCQPRRGTPTRALDSATLRGSVAVSVHFSDISFLTLDCLHWWSAMYFLEPFYSSSSKLVMNWNSVVTSKNIARIVLGNSGLSQVKVNISVDALLFNEKEDNIEFCVKESNLFQYFPIIKCQDRLYINMHYNIHLY